MGRTTVTIGGTVEVVFPYDGLYPEQRAYMEELNKALDAGGHALLEMPSGTGKTITLLAFLAAYMARYPSRASKVVYCTRTVEEMDKVMEEMRRLMDARSAHIHEENLLCVCLASRKHLCINPEVTAALASQQAQNRSTDLDSLCRALTAPWLASERPSSAIHRAPNAEPLTLAETTRTPRCSYFDALQSIEHSALAHGPLFSQGGIYDLDALRQYGHRTGCCPYFLARRLLNAANFVVYSYHYLLDPKVAATVSRDFTPDAIVVFDEAHNTDNICIESMSVTLDLKGLAAAKTGIMGLNNLISKANDSDARRLQAEYNRLMNGLNLASIRSEISDPDLGGAPQVAIPDTVLQQVVPKQLRKAEDFLACLSDIVCHLKRTLSHADQVVQQSSPRWTASLVRDIAKLDSVHTLKSASDRLTSLLQTLQVADWSSYRGLHRVLGMTAIASTYPDGFAIITEPFDDFTGQRNPKLQLACLDASIAIKPVFDKYRTVVMTSGTLSPLGTYPRMLKFQAKIAARFPMSLDRHCVCPLVVTQGDDQSQLSSKFSDRNSPDIARNYGDLLVQFCTITPDGVVAFFPSYSYMGTIIPWWKDNGVLESLKRQKLIFIETQDSKEASLAIQNYRLACDSGRGALLLSVARGRAAEGIDLDHHHGRCVILFGVPFQYTESRVLRARLEFLRENCQLREDDFLVFDAMRQAAQCVGRVIRNKEDYGIMVFADKRYQRSVLLGKLPVWIHQFISADVLGLDVASAAAAGRAFLASMAP